MPSHSHRLATLCALTLLSGCTLFTGLSSAEQDSPDADMSTGGAGLDMRPELDMRMESAADMRQDAEDMRQDAADMEDMRAHADMLLPLDMASEDMTERADMSAGDMPADMRETCATVDCGAAGTCVVNADAEAVCECDNGHTGERCELCMPGAQDNDLDGTCEPACETFAPGGCGPHGMCEDSSGLAECMCDTGYALPAPGAASCDACATGYMDDGTGDCMPSGCAGVSCALTLSDPNNSRGVCVPDANGVATCQCDAGFQDNDQNLTCRRACTASTCNFYELCEDTSGNPVCSPDPAQVYASCAQAKTNGNTEDGFYRLSVGGDASKPWWAVCTQLSSPTPKTYLPLGVTSGLSNRFQMVDEAGLLSETAFWMVRIDPVTLLVDIEDFSYSHTLYYQPGKTGPEHRAPYASAKACDNMASVEALGKIDLRHTPFIINEGFDRSGECVAAASFAATTSQGDQVVDLSLGMIGGLASGASLCGYVSTAGRAQQYGQTCRSDSSLVGTPPMANPSSQVLQLAYTSSQDVQNVPRFLTCQEIALWYSIGSTGERNAVLHLDRDPSKSQQVLCTGPAGQPTTYEPGIAPRAVYRAYVTLPEQANGSNQMEWRDELGNSNTTQYERVRLDLRTSSIDITDLTYATSTFNQPANMFPVNFGVAIGSSYHNACSAQCCGGMCPGQSIIDLRGTAIAVESMFELANECPTGGALYSLSSQVVTLTADGGFGGVAPQLLARQFPRQSSPQQGINQCASSPYHSMYDRDAQYYSEDDFLLRIAPTL